MKKDEVPQDNGMNNGMKEVAYAVNETGEYEMVPSLGWEPKNIANEQAWEVIEEEMEEVARGVRDGKKSTLAYHMVKNLMDEKLLSQYAGVSRWRVRRHLKPGPFKKLDVNILSKYAGAFGITVDELKRID